MKAEIYQNKSEYAIVIEPETVKESSMLTLLTMRGNFKLSESTINFAESGTQAFNINIPCYKSRVEKSFSMIKNSDLKII